MSDNPRLLVTSRSDVTKDKWARRRDIPIAILAWTALIAIVLWGAGHIMRTLIILAIAALLAYALVPAVTFLQRFMPRFVAILIVYLLAVGIISLVLYMIIGSMIQQVGSLTKFIQNILSPCPHPQLPHLEQLIQTFGI